MSRALPLMLLVLMAAACGVKRPLLTPKEIPAHEERLRKKREQLLQNQADIDNAPEQNKVTP